MHFVILTFLNYHFKIDRPVGNDPIAIFDLDNCLYNSYEYTTEQAKLYKSAFQTICPVSDEQWQEYVNETPFMLELFCNKLSIHPSEARSLVPMADFKSMVKPDEELISLIKKIKMRKFCFTNSTCERAAIKLRHLGLDDCFEVIFCTDDNGFSFVSKPKESAYIFVEEYLGVSSAKNIAFFDDSKMNIKGAEEAGWKMPILVNGDIKELIKKWWKNKL